VNHRPLLGVPSGVCREFRAQQCPQPGNLTATVRAAGSLASLAYAKARGATLRRDLIDIAARTARHGRGEITLHLPEGWHREQEWMNLFEAATGPPAHAA
jgi:hypothetical protein